MDHDIREMLAEAENERMHQIYRNCQTNFRKTTSFNCTNYFYDIYFVIYVISYRLAHKMIAYS